MRVVKVKQTEIARRANIYDFGSVSKSAIYVHGGDRIKKMLFPRVDCINSRMGPSDLISLPSISPVTQSFTKTRSCASTVGWSADTLIGLVSIVVPTI